MRRPPLLDLNLATSPVRNRRLFRLARALLVLLIVVSAGLAGYASVRYTLETRRLGTSLEEIRKVDAEGLREGSRLTADVQRAAKAGLARVEIVNGIIFRKSFSWTGLLSLLESALPDASYLTSLTPTMTDDKTVALKMRVVSNSLDDLLAFMNNLQARKFTHVFVENETKSGTGRLVSDLTMTYERDI
jgi:Tfp pilus assembly protein PilN